MNKDHFLYNAIRRKARLAMDKDCIWIRYQLCLYRAGRLSGEERARVNEHLWNCSECAYLLVLAPAFNDM